MRVLVFGPGVIGSLIAGRLAGAGHDVDVLGRGARLADIRARGVRLRHMRSGDELTARVGAVDALDPDAAYDWILVTLRADQVPAALPVVGSNRATPAVMIMSNRAAGYDAWSDAVGAERLVAGFPGAGGYIEDGVVHYSIAPKLVQPTTIGELDGRRSERIDALAAALRGAGLPVAVHGDMDAWQRYHVAWIGVFMLAGLVADGDPDAIVADKALRVKLVRAVREGFAVLDRLGFALTPRSLRMWTALPIGWVAYILGRIANRPDMRTTLEKQGGAQLGEARVVNAEIKALSARAGIRTPNLDALAELAFARFEKK